MAAKVTLSVIQGELIGETFEFSDRDICLIGRADECNPRLPDNEAHQTISRHHCLVDINPPQIRVRDFGSLNGTYINGEKIGQRKPQQTPEEGAKLDFPERNLNHGDQIELGKTVFQVSIEADEPAPVLQTLPPQDIERLNFINQLLAEANENTQELGTIGEYRLVKALGKGGYGKVYLALKLAKKEPVALKVALPEVVAIPGQIKRFQREIANNKCLDHPNIVNLFDSSYYQGTFFFTLEYCEGGSLRDFMQERGSTLSIDEALFIIMQVLDALEYAHNLDLEVPQTDGSLKQIRGFVHRDLKPSNILLTGEGKKKTAKVADYGLAKAFDLAGLSGLTHTGEAAGTPWFCPRQQIVEFKYCQPDVDVWAAAATLYFMLTGDSPRDFHDHEDPFKKILTSRAIPICERNPSIPKPLAQVIDQALIDDPEIPFKTAQSFRNALQKFQTF